MSLQLVEITNKDDHVLESYRFLEKRIFSISHGSMPSFEEHADFVANNPYRFWFFIQSDHLLTARQLDWREFTAFSFAFDTRGFGYRYTAV